MSLLHLNGPSETGTSDVLAVEDLASALHLYQREAHNGRANSYEGSVGVRMSLSQAAMKKTVANALLRIDVEGDDGNFYALH